MGPKVKFQRQFKPFDLCMMVWEISSYLNKKSKTRLILCLKSIKLSKMSLHEFDSHIYNLALLSKKGLPSGWRVSKDGWQDGCECEIPQRIFKFFMEVVWNAVSSVGVSCTETRVTDAISYTKLDRLLRDFARLCDTTKESIEVYFSKVIKVPRGNA